MEKNLKRNRNYKTGAKKKKRRITRAMKNRALYERNRLIRKVLIGFATVPMLALLVMGVLLLVSNNPFADAKTGRNQVASASVATVSDMVNPSDETKTISELDEDNVNKSLQIEKDKELFERKEKERKKKEEKERKEKEERERKEKEEKARQAEEARKLAESAKTQQAQTQASITFSSNNTASKSSASNTTKKATTKPKTVVKSASNSTYAYPNGFNFRGYSYPLSYFSGSGAVPWWTPYVYEWSDFRGHYLIERMSNQGGVIKQVQIGDVVTVRGVKYTVYDIWYHKDRNNPYLYGQIVSKRQANGGISFQTCEGAGSTQRLWFAK